MDSTRSFGPLASDGKCRTLFTQTHVRNQGCLGHNTPVASLAIQAGTLKPECDMDTSWGTGGIGSPWQRHEGSVQPHLTFNHVADRM